MSGRVRASLARAPITIGTFGKLRRYTSRRGQNGSGKRLAKRKHGTSRAHIRCVESGRTDAGSDHGRGDHGHGSCGRSLRVRSEPQGAGKQVTLIEAEHIERFVAETGLAMEPHEPRRNLVTRGIDLNALVGRRFLVGECELEGIELCEPCGKWARNTHREVVRFFVHKGGLNARIVKGGDIAIGSAVAARGASLGSTTDSANEGA